MQNLASVVLAAGDGKRLMSKIPKALHRVCGKPMLQHIIESLEALPSDLNVVVVGYAKEHIQQFLGENEHTQVVHQEQRLGTGHAVQMAAPVLREWQGDILVLNGDCPLIRTDSLRKLVERHRRQEAAATLLTANVDDPTGYGRVLRSDDDDVLEIVEQKDCNRYERRVKEINAGFYCFKASELFPALDQLKPDNQQAEYYLTDVVRILVGEGKRVEAYVVPDASETFGINNRVQLATAEGILRRRVLEELMLEGVTILSPETTMIDAGVAVGQDTIIRPFTILEGTTSIGPNCVVGPSVHLTDCTVGDGAQFSHCVFENRTIAADALVNEGQSLMTQPSDNKR